VFVTFSAGVTQFRPGETLEAALERADEALYEAKRRGKNRVVAASDVEETGPAQSREPSAARPV
jgi:PleD family two-component response regulator